MKLVLIGPGAVGGVVAARLTRAGHDVTVVARGRHLDAIRRRGIVLQTPAGTEVVELPATDRMPGGGCDALLLSVKGQDSASVLDGLHDVPVVCLQNGVANEREAARHTADVYGVPVVLPATHVEPGVVQQWSWPVPGMLDIGRWPTGVDDRAEMLAAAFRDAGFDSEARSDVMRWKYGKLLTNLHNAAEAAFTDPREVAALAREEGVAVLDAAGIAHVSDAEVRARWSDRVGIREIVGRTRGGGSLWQSLSRGSGVEVDWLNGEIVLIARLHGLEAPVNEALQRTVHEMVSNQEAPASRDPATFLDVVRSSAGSPGAPEVA